MTATGFEISDLTPFRSWTDALARNALAYQRCQECDKAQFPPRMNCIHCGCVRLNWRDSAGQGSVYSVTEVSAKDGNYNLVLVDLDEGFRMMSTVLGTTPAIGQRVQAHVEAGEQPRVVFEVQS